MIADLDTICHTILQAEEVLLSSVVAGVGPAERWASVQVLVCARVCSAPVISELLHHLHDSQQHQSGRRERAADLLARSSLTTVSSFEMVTVIAMVYTSLSSWCPIWYWKDEKWKSNVAHDWSRVGVAETH